MTGARYFRAKPSTEEKMSWDAWIRLSHRWLAIIFTLTVIANFIALSQGTPPAWITYSPLPPLFLMLFTGLYMFALPYLATRKAKRRQA
jgi:hypothetical protein